jgi:hypothetical protein
MTKKRTIKNPYYPPGSPDWSKRAKKPPTETTRVIGHLGVDAGMMYLGDPCYIVGSDSQIGKKIRGEWDAFLDHYIKDEDYPVWKIEDRGPGALGLVVTSGWGDGVYEVRATFNPEGRVKSMTITFIDDDDDDDRDSD